MKKILLLSLFLASQTILFAQFKTLAESPFLTDRQLGYERILFMKNGYTFYFSLKIKGGINVRTFDATHKQKSVKQLNPHLGKPSSFSIRGIFEVNGDVAVFISDVDDHTITLHRLIIDGETGALKGDEKIEDLTRFNYLKGYALIFGVPVPDFYVQKMPEGDGYAVAMMNSFESDRNKRISVAVYGADHKEINRAYYNSPEDKFKYMKFIGLAIPDKETISVLAYAYNTRASGGKECEVVLATMNRKDTTMVLHELLSTEKPSTKEVMRYNPVNKSLVLLQVTGYFDFDCTLSIIDPYTAKVNISNKVYSDNKKKSTDSPQDLEINRDGSFSIIYEDITNKQVMGANVTMESAILGDITVAQFDLSGRQTNTYTVPKNHFRKQYHKEALFVAGKQAFGMETFAYLSAVNSNYIVYNDEVENIEKVKAGKNVSKVKSLDECEGVYYNLKGSETVPANGTVFADAGKGNYNKGNFLFYDYDTAKDIYVTLKLEQRGDDNGFRLVWMQP